MSTRPSRRRPGAIIRAAAVAAVATALLAGCGGRSQPAGSPTGGGAGAISDPMATSVPSVGGPWATAAMGNLSQPLNTFWQLFHQPSSGGDWSNDVEVTATATNGGLVVATQGHDVVVGVVPSQNLTFTPVVVSHDDGRTFPVNGLLPEGIDPVPDALAESAGGQVLALVGGPGGPAGTAGSPLSEVVQGDTTLDHWPVLVSQSSLAGQPAAAACRISGLDAVTFDGEQPVLGATCAAPGAVGLFRYIDGGWEHDAPPLPPALAGDSVKVLAARQAGGSLAVLLGVSGRSGDAVLAAWGTDVKGVNSWETSAVLPLFSPTALVSIGAAGPTGWFVVQSTSSGGQTGSQIGPSAPSWSPLAALPAGTDTLAVSPDGQTTQALSGDQTTLDVWRLSSGRWAGTQSLPVQISFGSSN